MKRVVLMTVFVCAFPALGHAQIPLPGASVWKLWAGPTRERIEAGWSIQHLAGIRRLYQSGRQYLSDYRGRVGPRPRRGTVRNDKPGIWSASVKKQVMVPSPGPWQTRGTHQFSWWIPIPVVLQEFPQPLPSTSSIAYIEVRSEELDPAFECEVMQQGRWLGGMCELPNCPLIVDTGRNGYKLTSVENGVRFDLNADGVPEQVAWTRRDSDDAFLALDRNGNGRIDDGTELFGNHTPAGPDQPDVTTPNGFEALKFVETLVYGQSERNEVITSRDAVFSRLVLWRDLNHNGISEPDELQPVSESGLEAISTEYKNSKRVDKNGNEFRQRSRVKWSDGQYRPHVRRLAAMA